MSESQVKDEAEGAEEGEGGKRRFRLPPPRMLIIIGAAAAIVLGGGGGAAFFLLKPDATAGAKASKKGGDHGGGAKKGKKGKDGEEEGAETGLVREGPDGVVFYTLPDIVVNMQTAEGRPTFLKLKLTLELPDHATVDGLDPNMPRLQDMFQTFLRELRPEDLAGSQGSYQLRMEILRRVNLVIAPAKANAVLIEEMLIN